MKAKRNHVFPPLSLITGRSQPYVKAMLRVIGGFTPSICENGSIIYFPEDDATKINPEIDKDAISMITEVKEEVVKKLILKNMARIEPGKEICISLNPVGTTQRNSYQKIEELFNEVNKVLQERKINVNITHSKSAVDITPRGIDKCSGLRVLSSMLDIPIGQMAGIGDSNGDMSFLEKIGYAASPSNALDEVKRASNYVSKYADAAGVFDIVCHINKLNGTDYP